MNCRIASNEVLSLISDIQDRLNDLKKWDFSDKSNSEEILYDPLRQAKAVFDSLLANDSANAQNNESPLGLQPHLKDEKPKSFQSAEQDPEENTMAPASDNRPLPFMLVHISSDQRYLFVNQSYANWLGLDSSEMVGRHISDILPEEIYQTYLPLIQRVLSGEEVISCITFPSGDRLKYQDITLIPQLDESGSTIAYFAVIKDITDHKLNDDELRRSKMELEERVAWRTKELELANSALERSRDYLDMIINSISDPIFVINREHRLVLVNAAFCRLMSLPKEDLLGEEVHDFCFSREMADDHWQRNEEVFNSRWETVVEEIHSYSPGAPATVLIKRIPIIDSDGKWLIVGIIRDITDIKKAQERIRFQADLLEQVHNTVIATDLEGNIIYWNKSAETLLGWKSEEAMGKNIAETVVPEWGLDKMNRVISDLIKDRGNWDGEFYFKKKDGSTVPFHQCFSSIRDGRGELIGLVGVAVDLTERKHIEEALKKAKREAEEAARVKSDFLANMSHEIRTPMNAIIGMTSLLLEEPLTPEQRDCIEVIETNGDALLTVINDILDFSKMENNKTVLEECQFAIAQCVEDSLDLVGINAANKGLNLAYSIDKSVPEMIVGDPSKLKQVLGNLLSNAVKFTDKGEVVVTVSAQEVDGDNVIQFEVRDTGIGIPQNRMKLLFLPFSQMEPSTSRLYGGTGLGLAISKRLVEMMKGRIWAESSEGTGSSFHFTIRAPAVKLKFDSPAATSQMIGRRVVIIVDNETTRRILCKQICDWGMIPLITSSAWEAIQCIQRGGVDIAILDTDLLDNSGLELAEEIQRCMRTMPLLLLTTRGKQVPDGYSHLTKPLKPTQLHRALSDILPNSSEKEIRKEPVKKEKPQISPLRILLAEDDMPSQWVAQKMLKRLGYRADTACNGSEVLLALEQHDFDVVLMDWRMPEMDGLEATRIIRQRWPKSQLKIIALTAYALPGDMEKCLEAGMDGYISKPLRKEDLARELEKYQRDSTSV